MPQGGRHTRQHLSPPIYLQAFTTTTLPTTTIANPLLFCFLSDSLLLFLFTSYCAPSLSFEKLEGNSEPILRAATFASPTVLRERKAFCFFVFLFFNISPFYVFSFFSFFLIFFYFVLFFTAWFLFYFVLVFYAASLGRCCTS